MKYNNIVVSGDVGTGTSTLALGLAKKLGWKHLSAGDIFRPYFKKQNIPLWKKSEIPDSFDKEVDHDFFEKMKNDEHIVFDSHYSGWFARDLDNVLRILLTADKKVATNRILNRRRSYKETAEEIEKRRHELRAKFKKLYSGENYEDTKYFHLVIDTTQTGVNETIQKAYQEFKKNY